MRSRVGNGSAGQRVVRQAREPGAEFLDVRARSGDVGAPGLAFSQDGTVVRFSDAACFGAVEDAVEPASWVDLEYGILEQLSGLSPGEEDPPSEFLAGYPDASFQFAGGRSADVAATVEVRFEVCGLVDPFEPLFEGKIVREARGVVSGVALGDVDVEVAVLDCRGDEAAGRRTMCQARVRRKRLG
ncbi:hypothetical protein AHiyo8_pI70020 (plasmid) [Arthrobacter sp. Hiyo8]|nr:hypothetical protein AHiyo8_pI70020 [Arthrobacter sp. Hiyo8]